MKFKLAKIKVLNEVAPFYFVAPLGLFKVKRSAQLFIISGLMFLVPFSFLLFLIFDYYPWILPRILNKLTLLLYPPPGTPSWAIALGHALYPVSEAFFIVIAPFASPIIIVILLRRIFSVDGELITEWSNVSRVEIVNERVFRRVVRYRTSHVPHTRVVTVTYGDLRFFTRDGREIVVRNVKDPHKILDYLKTKYGLDFSNKA
ncbi:MAG: hypothetical protein ACP5HQ_03445 [Thermoprotei archaeon]